MNASAVTPQNTMDRVPNAIDLAAVDRVGEAGLQRVNQLTNNMLNIVDTLNDQISGVLAKQEREFLRAYRAHMYTVQRELQSLRAKADEAALQMQRDERLKSLIAERDWYRSESLRLDQFGTSLKGELDYLRDKIHAVEQDRVWLEKEVKTARRKVLQLERANAILRGEAVAPLDDDELDINLRSSSRASSPVRLGSSPVGSRTGTATSTGALVSTSGQHGHSSSSIAALRSPLRATGAAPPHKSDRKTGSAVSESKTGPEGSVHQPQTGEGGLAAMTSRELLNLLGGGKLVSAQQQKPTTAVSTGAAQARPVAVSRSSMRR